MNRVLSLGLCVLGAALISGFGVSRMQAQTPATPPQVQAQKPEAAPPAQKPAEGDAEEEENPFAPQPAPVLPPGMRARIQTIREPS